MHFIVLLRYFICLSASAENNRIPSNMRKEDWSLLTLDGKVEYSDELLNDYDYMKACFEKFLSMAIAPNLAYLRSLKSTKNQSGEPSSANRDSTTIKKEEKQAIVETIEGERQRCRSMLDDPDFVSIIPKPIVHLFYSPIEAFDVASNCAVEANKQVTEEESS